jgi:hypothetical protein
MEHFKNKMAMEPETGPAGHDHPRRSGKNQGKNQRWNQGLAALQPGL